jgi:hypothetical protein
MRFSQQRTLREKRLQEELEKEKLHFLQTSKRAAQVIRRDLVIESLPHRIINLDRHRGFRGRIYNCQIPNSPDP